MSDKPKLDGRAFVMGRVVHYVSENGVQFPMILTYCHTAKDGNHYASGVVFGPNGAKFETLVPYNITRIGCTWHWPTTYAKKKKPEPGKPLRDLTASKK